ncbi:MAG: hypothetical protein ACP5I1_06740 [Candidatus Hinthialibacter sp.]
MYRQPFFTIALLVAVSFFSGRGISEAQERGPSILHNPEFKDDQDLWRIHVRFKAL